MACCRVEHAWCIRPPCPVVSHSLYAQRLHHVTIRAKGALPDLKSFFGGCCEPMSQMGRSLPLREWRGPDEKRSRHCATLQNRSANAQRTLRSPIAALSPKSGFSSCAESHTRCFAHRFILGIARRAALIRQRQVAKHEDVFKRCLQTALEWSIVEPSNPRGRLCAPALSEPRL